MSFRPISYIGRSESVMEGAGVPVHRVFGNESTGATDPFLLLDHLKNEDPTVNMPGFPWHPHRGIETITYILEGGVQHEDSLGNKGVLTAGDVQWMTAGSGIVHQEMPAPGMGSTGHGFQLWANLPAAEKMTSPRYQDIGSAEIPTVVEDDGTTARVITGSFWGATGPVTGIATDPRYLDITIPPHTSRSLPVETEYHAFAYVFEGSGTFRGASAPIPAPTEYMSESGITEPITAHPVENRNLVLFDRGDEIRVETNDEQLRFLLVSGRPLREPVAWHGPIVMNTEEELVQAFSEYRDGTFLRHG